MANFFNVLAAREINGNRISPRYQEHLRNNMMGRRVNLQAVKCFTARIMAFDVVDHYAVCCNELHTIKLLDLNTKKKIWKIKTKEHLDSSLFKIVDGKLVHGSFGGKITMRDLMTGEVLVNSLISSNFYTGDACIAHNKIYGVFRKAVHIEKIVIWNLDGIKEKSFPLKATDGPEFNFGPKYEGPLFTYNDSYIVYLNDFGCHWIDLQNNKFDEYFPEKDMTIAATCLQGDSFYLAIKTKSLFQSYLLKIDLKTKKTKTIELNLSSVEKLTEKMKIKQIQVQNEKIFLRVGNYVVSCAESIILGRCGMRLEGEDAMDFILNEEMLMFVSHKVKKRMKITELTIRDLNSSQMQTFNGPVAIGVYAKRGYYSFSESRKSVRFLEGKCITISKGNLLLFDFFNSRRVKEKTLVNNEKEKESDEGFITDTGDTDSDEEAAQFVHFIPYVEGDESSEESTVDLTLSEEGVNSDEEIGDPFLSESNSEN